MRRALPFVLLAAVLALLAWLALRGTPGDVVVYCAVDEEYARGILAEFERSTGIRVDLKVDSEASKTVGLANALMEEGKPGGRVRADVYWNNEPLWTVRLARAGVLEKYDPPTAADIPAAHRDPAGFWTANGLRARVLIAHRPGVAERRPSSWRDFVDPAWKGRAAIARPLAGTTLSHVAALRALVGADAVDGWLRGMADNDVGFASGNGSLARDVGAGGHAFGFTDTDDMVVRLKAGDPVERIFPDQGEGQVGTFVLPVTVSLVRGAPHGENGRRLVDWLVGPECEALLSATPYATIPVRPTTRPGPDASSPKEFRAARVDWNAAVEHIDPVLTLVQRIVEGR